jgi:hypothetical protein
MRKLAAGCLILLFFQASAQDKLSTLKQDSIAGLFYSDRAHTLPIYNGRQFIGYSNKIEGFPYFLHSDWQAGSVKFEGIWYHDLPLMYDTYQDQVIVRSPKGFPFILINERVQEFKLAGQLFIRITENGKNSVQTGFYQQLVSGKAVVFAKRQKMLDEKIDGTEIEKKFRAADRYFLFINGEYHSIHKQRDLFDAMSEKRQAFQEYLKKEGLKFKNNPEAVIVRLAELYNQSHK